MQHALLATLAVAVLTALAVHLRARRYGTDERSDPETAANLERLRRVGTALGWVVGVVVGLWLDAPAVWARVVAALSGLGPEPTATLGAALALLVPAVAAAVAARLGTLPLQRTVERVTPTYREVLRFELERETALVAGFLVASLVVLVVPGGWPRIGAAVALGGVVTAGTPAWLLLTHQARPPTAAEAVAVDRALPDSVTLLVVEGQLSGFSAVAAGVVPGARYVFLDATLFELLDGEEVRAVVAHEVGHHRHGHVAMRYGLLVGGVAPLLVAAEFAPGLLAFGVPLAGGYALLALAALRRMELTADAAADGPALADALASLARLGYLRVGGDGPVRLLGVHPPLLDRVRRLRNGAAGR